MVHIHLISLHQRGVTEALAVFIVMPFLPGKEAGGIGGGEVSTQAVLFSAGMSFVS